MNSNSKSCIPDLVWDDKLLKSQTPHPLIQRRQKTTVKQLPNRGVYGKFLVVTSKSIPRANRASSISPMPSTAPSARPMSSCSVPIRRRRFDSRLMAELRQARLACKTQGTAAWLRLAGAPPAVCPPGLAVCGCCLLLIQQWCRAMRCNRQIRPVANVTCLQRPNHWQRALSTH